MPMKSSGTWLNCYLLGVPVFVMHSTGAFFRIDMGKCLWKHRAKSICTRFLGGTQPGSSSILSIFQNAALHESQPCSTFCSLSKIVNSRMVVQPFTNQLSSYMTHLPSVFVILPFPLLPRLTTTFSRIRDVVCLLQSLYPKMRRHQYK